MFWLLLLITPYLLLYLYIYIGLARTAREDSQPDLIDLSTEGDSSDIRGVLSVIIPVRNEINNISDLIECLANQSYPQELTEIIIIDDNSTDNTYTEAVRLTKRFKNFKVYRNKDSGKKNAIHSGINQSKGDLIITTDADCRFEPGWLTSIQITWSATKADLIIGYVKMGSENRLLAPLIEIEHASIQAVTIASSYLGRPVMASAANLAFSRSLADGYINFIRPDLASGDDMFLLHHAKKKGKAIVFNPSYKGIVKTMFNGSLVDFIRQRSRWSAKGIYYNDSDTTLFGAITALTNIGIVAALLSAFISISLIKLTLFLYIIKSIPDILILIRMDGYLSRKTLIIWFIPLQLIYPFYVTATLISGILFKTRWVK